MQSHHKFNEHKTVESVVNRIKGGETVALISDAVLRVFPIRVSGGFASVFRNGIRSTVSAGGYCFCSALVASVARTKSSALKVSSSEKGRMTRLKVWRKNAGQWFYDLPPFGKSTDAVCKNISVRNGRRPFPVKYPRYMRRRYVVLLPN